MTPTPVTLNGLEALKVIRRMQNFSYAILNHLYSILQGFK